MKDIGRTFMEMTKYHHLGQLSQMQGIIQPPLESSYDSSKPLIQLPAPMSASISPISIATAIKERKSSREYKYHKMLLNELSFLLWATQGIKETIDNAATMRTVPSAGARHALETYVLVNNVKELKEGLYRFVASKHALLSFNSFPDINEKVTSACLGQKIVDSSAVTFIWIADVKRMKWRYGERAYRYLHLDVGHVCQNLYLAVQTMQCGTCAIAAFDDDAINGVLELDGINQFVIYCASVGKID